MLTRTLAAAALLAVASTPGAAQVVEDETESVLLETIAARSVVQIEKGRNSGTGFIVSNQGHVLTAWHVLDNISKKNSGVRYFKRIYKIYLNKRVQGETCVLKAKLVGGSNYRDVAVLKIRKSDWKRAMASENDDLCPGRLEPIALDDGVDPADADAPTDGLGAARYVVIGHPATCDDADEKICFDSWQKTPHRLDDGFGMIELHSRVQKGISGGPVLTAKGRLVGMTVATGTVGDNDVMKVVPLEVLRRSLWEFGVDQRMGDYRDDMRYILSQKAKIASMIDMLKEMNSEKLESLLRNSREVEKMLSKPTIDPNGTRISPAPGPGGKQSLTLAMLKPSKSSKTPRTLVVWIGCGLPMDSAFFKELREKSNKKNIGIIDYGNSPEFYHRYEFTIETTAVENKDDQGNFRSNKEDPETGQASIEDESRLITVAFNRNVADIKSECRRYSRAYARRILQGTDKRLKWNDLGEYNSLALRIEAHFHEGDQRWEHDLSVTIPLRSGS